MSLFRMLLAPVLALSFPFFLHAQPIPIRVAYDEWPPYTAEKMPDHGFANEIVNRALTRLGYLPQMVPTSAEDSEKGLAEGKYDVHPSSWKTPQREKFLLFSEPYFSNQIVIISSKRTLTPPNSLAELAGKKVGLSKGYGYGTTITGNKDLIPVYANDIGENLGLLKQGRLDAVIGDRFVAQYISISQTDPSPDALNFSTPLEEKALHVVVSRKYPEAAALVAGLNAKLAEMRTDGTLEAILKKHGMRR